MINELHKKLAIEARDATANYEQKNFLFQKGAVTVDEVIEAKARKEKIEKHFRAIMKKEHRRIEATLKKKYASS